MFFTQDDYKKIQQWLIKNSVKDTEFNEANIPFNGEETITIVQGNQNKKVFLKDLIAQVFNLGISDFVNITDKYDAPNISLEEAIRLIPSRARKEGQVITFLNKEDGWNIYQFKGVLNQWNVLDTWEDLFDWEKLIIDSILPDEEDLTKSLPDANGNSYLSLKDREYNPEDFSGLGRIILRKNIVEIEDPIYGKVKKNILYQDMFTQSNTIYEIRYDFDLNGAEITIPEGCVLQFEGGRLSNGTIVGNNTFIKSNITQIFNTTINIKGGWNVVEIYPEWFGAKGDGTTDDSNAINKLSGFAASMYHYPIIKLLNNKVYAVANTVITDCWMDFNGSKLIAISQMDSLLKINIQIRGKNPNVSFSIPDGIKIFNGVVDGNGLSDICVQTTGIGTIFISNLSIKNPTTYGICANTPMQLTQSPMVYMENCRILIEEDKIDLSKTTYAIHTNFNDSYFNAVEIRDFTYGIYDYGGNNRFISIHHWMYRGAVNKSTFARTSNDSIYENCVIDTVRYVFSIHNPERLLVRGCNVFTNTDVWRHSIAEGSASDNVFLFLFNNRNCYTKACDLYVHTPIQVIVSNLEANEIDHLFLDNPDIKGKEIKSAYYILSNYRSQRYINTAISDLNSLVQEGVYSMIGNAKNLKNKPNGLNNVDLISVETIRTSNITLKQVAYYPTSDLGYDTYIRKATYGNNTWTFTSWGRYRGEVDVVYSGDSTKRPTLSNASIGFRYFDTTINKPIYWTGTKWVDATGANV